MSFFYNVSPKRRLISSINSAAPSLLSVNLPSTNFLLSTENSPVTSQTKPAEYFFNTIASSSVNISKGSFTFRFIVLLISIGITTRPSSSIFLTIPVDFIFSPS
ncbi:transition state regulator Abh [Listeria monocytogenes]|nr:transition state regulator Abh [Listeria monocytogenes]